MFSRIRTGRRLFTLWAPLRTFVFAITPEPYPYSMPVSTPQRLCIALCCNSAFGVINFRRGLILRLLELGHRVVVIAPEEPPYSEQLRQLGVEFLVWGVSGRGSNPLTELAMFWRLARLYRQVRPDFAVHYTIKPVIYGALAAWLSGARSLSVITGLGYVFINNTFISRFAQYLYARTLRLSTEVWFLNEDDRKKFDELRLLEQMRVRNLPGEGIDTHHFSHVALHADGEERIILFVGRMLRDKGVLEFVEAARLLKRRHAQLRFQLLGAADWDNPSAISAVQIQEWVDQGIVEYLGTTLDVRPAIAAAHCVVLPSYREGVPRTLLEASAMGRPLVATNVPGCKDVVLDGVTGLLCKSHDPLDLAAKIEQLIVRPLNMLEVMGQQGRSYVIAHFEESRVIDQYLDFLDSRAAG